MTHSAAEIWEYERDHGKPQTLAQVRHYVSAHEPMPPSRAHLRRLKLGGKGYVAPPDTPKNRALPTGLQFYRKLLHDMGNPKPCVDVIDAKTGNIPTFTDLWDIVDADGKHVRRGIPHRIDAGRQASKLKGQHYVVPA